MTNPVAFDKSPEISLNGRLRGDVPLLSSVWLLTEGDRDAGGTFYGVLISSNRVVAKVAGLGDNMGVGFIQKQHRLQDRGMNGQNGIALWQRQHAIGVGSVLPY